MHYPAPATLAGGRRDALPPPRLYDGSFLARLVHRSDIPDYALLIPQASCKQGGLGIFYPSHQAAPAFVLTITIIQSSRYATNGFGLNEDLTPVPVHESIQHISPCVVQPPV